jgi:hypothetical protein
MIPEKTRIALIKDIFFISKCFFICSGNIIYDVIPMLAHSYFSPCPEVLIGREKIKI